MIEINGVNKSFGSLKALDNIIATIQERSEEHTSELQSQR